MTPRTLTPARPAQPGPPPSAPTTPASTDARCREHPAGSAAAATSAFTAAIRSAAIAALVAAVRVYQATLSPILGWSCRFTPTCSEYFIAAVTRKGPLRGTALGVYRLLRCNPLCKAGHDPVPD